MKKLILSSLLSLGLAGSVFAAPTTWKIDPAHSSVTFSVRHAFSKVPGVFSKFDGSIVYDADNLSASAADAKIEVASVNTNDAKRDGHLQKDDFFSADKFPAITFKSKSWKKTGENTFDIVGDLTIKDVTKEIVLKTKLLGTGPGPRGKVLSGWEGTATIDRTEFGVNYGTPLVGKDVEIVVNIEASQA